MVALMRETLRQYDPEQFSFAPNCPPTNCKPYIYMNTMTLAWGHQVMVSWRHGVTVISPFEQNEINFGIVQLTETAKLSSGYQRDLQRLKAPLFRSIDLAGDTLEIMAHALKGVSFRAENINLSDDLFAAERANELVVEEGIPFREAYQRVAKALKQERD